MSKKKFCENCRHFDPFDAGDDDTVHEGWCSRFPPVYVGRPFSWDNDDVMDGLCWTYPVVGIKAWCGEWEKK